jgi:AICAR transformylase/IMP cyclohydrolase PurH
MNKVESIHDRIVMKTEAKSSTVLFAEGFKVVGLGFMAGQSSRSTARRLPPFCLSMRAILSSRWRAQR